MAISVTHSFVSPVVDENDPNEVGPDEWNDAHVVTGAVEAISSTDHAVVRFDGANGQIQNSSAILADSGLLTVTVDDASDNSVFNALSLVRTTSGTPAAGIGTSLNLVVETSGGNNEVGAVIEAVTSDVTGGSEDFSLRFKTMIAGAAAAESFRTDRNGYVNIGGLKDNLPGVAGFAAAAKLEVGAINDANPPVRFYNTHGWQARNLFTSTHAATPDAHSAMQDFDGIMDLTILGSDGDDFFPGANFAVYADGNTVASSGIVPCQMVAYVTNATGAQYGWYVRASGHMSVGESFFPPDRRLHVEETNATTDAVTPLLRLQHRSSGVPDVGTGVGLEFMAETSADNHEVGATIEAVTTDVSAGSEDFDVVIKNMAGGAAAAERFRVLSAAGQFTVNSIKHTASDANLDVLYGWDDGAATYKSMLLADIATEASPAAGDFLLMYGAEGDVRKVDWDDLPGAGSGIAEVAEDTSPTLGGNLEGGGFSLGTSGSQASDVFLEEGGVINWDGGDLTMTQTGNSLAIAGGTLTGASVDAAADTSSGVIELAIQSEMETGTDVVRAVTPGRQQFHPSAAKFWARATQSTTTIQQGYNVASVEDTGAGRMTVNIATDFSGTTYVPAVGAEHNSASGTTQTYQIDAGSIAAGSFIGESWQVDGTEALTDPSASWMFWGFGDQA